MTSFTQAANVKNVFQKRGKRAGQSLEWSCLPRPRSEAATADVGVGGARHYRGGRRPHNCRRLAWQQRRWRHRRLATMRQAVEITAGRVELEASGGVTLDTVAAIAATGVDYVSVGALTHSVRALDISLEMESQTLKLI